MSDQECRNGDLQRLLTRVAELPREIAPRRDLWAAVAERLVERPAAEPAGRGPRRAPAEPWRAAPGRGARARRWLVRAAAALVFMALGALLAELARFHGEAPAGAARALPGTGRVAPASASASGFEEIEAEYLRAKEALWLMVYSRHEELSPVTLEIVRRNLLIVDDAIRDLREALEEDPGNRQLESSLLAQHRRSLHLLHRLAKTL
jgi:hypothetical protein